MISFSHPITTTKATLSSNGREALFLYPCADYSSCYPYTIQLLSGTYYLEVWGAQGGNSTAHGNLIPGGLGGYSSGLFIVHETKTNLYLHIGGTTQTSTGVKAPYNGGGAGISINDGPGGGATDFRKLPGSWNQELQSRILVAGGGGGGFDNGNLQGRGGAGGGLQGFQGTPGTNSPCVGTQSGCEGSQTCPGIFGKGGSNSYGGGGGGYFGGGCGYMGGNGGSGGSGYVGGVFGYPPNPVQINAGINNGFGRGKITFISGVVKNSCKNSNGKLLFSYIIICLFS